MRQHEPKLCKMRCQGPELRPGHQPLEHAERRDFRRHARRGAAPERESVARELPTPRQIFSTRIARRSGELRSSCRFNHAFAFNADISGWNTQNAVDMSWMRDTSATPERESLASLDACGREAVSRRAALGVQVLPSLFFQPGHRPLGHEEGHDDERHARRGAAPERASVARKASDTFEHPSTRVVVRAVGEPRSACRFYNAEKFNQDIGGWNTTKVTSFERMRIAARQPNESPSRGNFRRLGKASTRVAARRF